MLISLLLKEKQRQFKCLRLKHLQMLKAVHFATLNSAFDVFNKILQQMSDYWLKLISLDAFFFSDLWQYWYWIYSFIKGLSASSSVGYQNTYFIKGVISFCHCLSIYACHRLLFNHEKPMFRSSIIRMVSIYEGFPVLHYLLCSHAA